MDSVADGPSVFFHLGALRSGDRVDITLTGHRLAVIGVTAVRLYPKKRFPATRSTTPAATPRCA